jgi:hypothetical protein
MRGTGDHKENELNKVCRHIDEHHGQYGVALFIVPVLLGALALLSIVNFLAWVLR